MYNRLNYFIAWFVIFTFFACASTKVGQVKHNFTGHIFEHKYNGMPMVDKPSSKGAPLMTTLYIYEPTRRNQIEDNLTGSPIVTQVNSNLVDSVHSNQTGLFSMYLKPGKYSVFIKYKNGYYIPYYSGVDWVSIIQVNPKVLNTLNFEIKDSGLFYE